MRQIKKILCSVLVATLLVSGVTPQTVKAANTTTESNIVSTFLVTFKDADGNVIETQKVESGKSANIPNNKAFKDREGFELHWTKSFTNVTEDIVTQAEWVKKTYNVIFMDGDTIANQQKVEYSSPATAPAITKVGYTLYWDKFYDNIKSDTTINAIWQPETYTITYNTGKATNDARNVPTYRYGETTTIYNPTRSGYIFKGWYNNEKYAGNAIKNIPSTSHSNLTLYAKFVPVSLSKANIKKAKLNKKKTYATVSWKTVKNAKKYTVELSKDKKFKKVIKKTTTKLNQIRFSKLSKKSKYYVRVKAYTTDSKGKMKLGSISKIKKLKK